MATTENGIYYPNDGTKAADILTDLKAIAESVDKNIQENKFDDKDVKKDISDIKKEQETQNADIKNLQINDNKQDELISKLKNVALNAETEEAKSLHVTDANKFGQLEVLGNHEQETAKGIQILQNTNQGNIGYNFSTNPTGKGKVEEINFLGTKGAKFSLTEKLTSWQYITRNVDLSKLKNNTTYTIQFDCKTNYNENNLLIRIQAGDTSRNFLSFPVATVNNETKRIKLVATSNDTVLNGQLLYIQANALNEVGREITITNLILVEGDYSNTELEWEDYTDLEGSPSPNHPSEVVCLGSNKQLFDKSTAVEGLLQGDGTLSYSDNNYSTSDFIKVVPKKSYYKTITGSSRFKFFDEEKSPISSTYNDLIDPTKAQSFEIPENAHYIRFTFLKTYIDEIKIEEGTEATSYSPYNQGSTKISKINKNLFDKNNANILKAYIGQISKKITAGTYHRTIFLKVNSGDTYTIKKYVGNGLIVGQLKELPKIEDVVDNFISTESETPSITTKISNGYNYLVAYVVNNEDNTEDEILNSIQIEKGNVATDYIEHQQTDYLLYIQQEMLKGDYFVKEADGWKEVHSYPKKIFDGTENINLESLSQGNNFYTNIPDALGDTTVPVYSNCFMYYNGLLDKNYSCRISGSKNLNMRCNEKNTVEEFKQMLADKYNAGNPVYAFYKSAIPSKLACTPEQSAVLEELNNLDLYKPVTNIITAEDIALLKLKYALDVKTYVNNQLANVNAQILNIAGGN